MIYIIYLVALVAASVVAAHCYKLKKIQVSIMSFVVGLLLLWQYGFTFSFIKVALFTIPLVVVSFYDIKTHHIPMVMVLIMILTAILFRSLTVVQMIAAILFVAVVLFPFAFFNKGLGMGDIYLLLPIALILGLPHLLYAIILGLLLFILCIGAYSLYQHLKNNKDIKRKPVFKTKFALGPWLSLGTVIILLLIA